MPRVAGVYGKMEVEDCHALPIGPIARYTGLQPGVAAALKWTRGGHETGSVAYTVLEGAIRFSYQARGRSYLVPVRVTYTGLVSGGRRPWWTCPACGRRCGVLYLRGGQPACRLCHDLVYASQHTRIRKGGDLLDFLEASSWGRALMAEVESERMRQRAEIRAQVAAALGDTARPPARGRGRPRTKRPYTRRADPQKSI